MDGCSEVIAAATFPVPAQRYASPIPRLSTASLISRTYLIVRDPGHYRVALLSRGSYVTNGKRMIAAKVAVGSDHGEDVQPAHQRPWPAPAGGGWNASTGSACSPT